MRKCLMFLLLVFSQILQAQSTFDSERLKEFYDTFLCEEKDATAEANVTSPCTAPPPGAVITACGALRDRPTIAPLTQASIMGLDYIPIVLVNDSGQADSDVYFVIFGQEVTGCTSSGPTVGNYAFISFGPQPGPVTSLYGSYVLATSVATPPASDYSYQFSTIPLTNGQRIIYVPHLSAGTILFSMSSSLPLTVGANSIADPNPGYNLDPSYNFIYGAVEFTFYPNDCPNATNPLNALTIDFTCVDYFGIPIYLNLYTQNPLPGLPQNRPSGIYQSRAYTLCTIRNAFAQAYPDTLAVWNSLIQKPAAATLRILSPGNALGQATPGFDQNYLDNAASYAYSWANAVWTGASAYYLNNILSIQTNDGTSYNGKIINGIFTFKSSLDTFGIPWQNVPPNAVPSTTTSIFNVSVYFPGMTYSSSTVPTCVIGAGGCSVPGDALTRATEITQYLSAVIPAGLVPGKIDKLTPTAFPPSLFSSYYTPNVNLTPPGATTGPWFDLYSLGLHGNADINGNAVYSYAYDDYLYHQAPVSQQVAPSQTSIDDTTFITIVVGPYSDN